MNPVRASLAQSTEIADGSDQKQELLPPLDSCACMQQASRVCYGKINFLFII